MLPARTRPLASDEEKALVPISRSRTLCAGRVRRAQIILLSNRGLLAAEIAGERRIHARTARRWIERFNARGVDGLDEGKRAGHSRVSATRDVGGVIEAALIKPDALDLPFGSWTLDRLVAYLREVKGVPLKRSRLSEIFRHEGLRWHTQEGWFGARVDPDVAEKRGPSRPFTPPLSRAASSCA